MWITPQVDFIRHQSFDRPLKKCRSALKVGEQFFKKVPNIKNR
jgi:hypothetical protein